jgi:hypothetical protein
MRRVIRKIREERIWKGITFCLTLVTLVAVASVATMYMNRPEKPALKAPNISSKVLKISPRSERMLTDYMKTKSLIVAISTVDADLAKNERRTTFLTSQNVEFQQIWDSYILRREPSPALFTKEPDQNDRIANLLNGNLDCREFKRTINMGFIPEAEKIAPWICSISVPPGFDGSGDFVGFINFFLTRELSDREKKRLSVDAVDISTAIYNQDLK